MLSKILIKMYRLMRTNKTTIMMTMRTATMIKTMKITNIKKGNKMDPRILNKTHKTNNIFTNPTPTTNTSQ